MKILVTGGTGYIGSHVVVELLQQNHEVVIVDNLINSKLTVLENIKKITKKSPIFYQANLINCNAIEKIFKEHKFDLVMHFAGLKSVTESIKKPIIYYQQNLTSTINLLKCMEKFEVKKIIFSSSATVYGNKAKECTENMPTGQNISNPYGKTKYMIEEILKDVCTSDPNFSVVALRYFNPIGNHNSGLLGEDINDNSDNLMPQIIKVAKDDSKEFYIYGNDYDTSDGTCRRDFIHVTDLANGHIAAFKALETPGFKTYNLGTGTSTSILEMVAIFEKVSKCKLPYKFAPRRPGDLAEVWANISKAKNELDWQAKLTIEDAIKGTLAFIQHSNRI